MCEGDTRLKIHYGSVSQIFFGADGCICRYPMVVLYPIVVPHIAHAQTQTVYGRRLNVKIWVSLHDGSPLGDSSPSHCACSDTNGLRHKAQHNRACSDNKTVYSIRLNININISGLS